MASVRLRKQENATEYLLLNWLWIAFEITVGRNMKHNDWYYISLSMDLQHDRSGSFGQSWDRLLGLTKIILKRQLGFLANEKTSCFENLFNRQNRRHSSNRKAKNKNLDIVSFQPSMIAGYILVTRGLALRRVQTHTDLEIWPFALPCLILSIVCNRIQAQVSPLNLLKYT